MTGDEIPVILVIKQFSMGERYVGIGDPRHLSGHGYVCPICNEVIEACHNAAARANALLLWEDDKDVTLPPLGIVDNDGLAEVCDFDIVSC